MNPDNQMTVIVGHCLSIDEKASLIYEEMAVQADTDELKQFWSSMASEESSHTGIWKRLLELAENDNLPQVFDDPDEVVAELQEIDRNVGNLLDRYRQSRDLPGQFILAFRLELYLLHQALDTLYNLFESISEQQHREEKDIYEQRIHRFIDMLAKYGEVTPEVELLGETLHRLWRHNRNLALHGTLDEMTGLYNRRGFMNAARPLCHLAQRNEFNVGVLIADIDDFKTINDTLGHLAGDSILKEVARSIKANVRICDVVGRFGGDEFIILFSKTDREATELLAEKVRHVVETGLADKTPVTISIGIADGILGNKVDEALEALIREADTCLYQAKEQGKNQFVISDL